MGQSGSVVQSLSTRFDEKMCRQICPENFDIEIFNMYADSTGTVSKADLVVVISKKVVLRMLSVNEVINLLINLDFVGCEDIITKNGVNGRVLNSIETMEELEELELPLKNIMKKTLLTSIQEFRSSGVPKHLLGSKGAYRQVESSPSNISAGVTPTVSNVSNILTQTSSSPTDKSASSWESKNNYTKGPNTSVTTPTSTLRDYESYALVRTLKGHTDVINCLTSIGDGIVASASMDNNIRLWRCDTGECIRILEGHTDWVMSLLYLGENQLVSGSNDETIRVWNTQTGECLKNIHADHHVYSLVANPSKRGSFISGDSYGNIELSTVHKILSGHTSDVRSIVAIGTDRIATGSWDHMIKIWELSSGECVQTLEGHEDYVYALCIANNNTLLVSGSNDNTIRVWDLTTGICVRIIREHSNAVKGLALLPNGLVVSGSVDKTIRIWDIELGICKKVFKTGNIICCMSVLDDGKIVCGHGDNTVTLWG